MAHRETLDSQKQKQIASGGPYSSALSLSCVFNLSNNVVRMCYCVVHAQRRGIVSVVKWISEWIKFISLEFWSVWTLRKMLYGATRLHRQLVQCRTVMNWSWTFRTLTQGGRCHGRVLTVCAFTCDRMRADHWPASPTRLTVDGRVN